MILVEHLFALLRRWSGSSVLVASCFATYDDYFRSYRTAEEVQSCSYWLAIGDYFAPLCSVR